VIMTDELIKYDETAIGQPKNYFIPLTKVDELKREVWGFAAVEEPDNADEIMDYASSKPQFEKWSAAASQRSGGRSLGNLRGMHQPIAAGKLISLQPDDAAKGIFIGTKVVDDNEWRKVMAGVYTGFSVGGHYLRKWQDFSLGKTRYTAEPVEISLVDAPCIPSATYQMIKADGLTEIRPFAPTNGENVLKAEPEEEELAKVDLPSSQEPAGTITPPTYKPEAQKENPIDVTVQRMPDSDRAIQVSPTDPPTGETLAGLHAGVQSIQAAAEEMMKGGNIPALLKVIQQGVADLEKAYQATLPAPAAQARIPVKQSLIKVNKRTTVPVRRPESRMLKVRQ
jgi:hypothetical protein